MDQQKAKTVFSTPPPHSYPEHMAMPRSTGERPCGIYEEDLPELRQAAIPAARYLAERRMPAAEMRIMTDYVDVHTPEAGTPFTDEDGDKIFAGLSPIDYNFGAFMRSYHCEEYFRQEDSDATKQVPVTDHYGVCEKDLPELRRLALPLARFLLEHGMLMDRVIVQTHRVDVQLSDAGSPFTDEEREEIFEVSATEV